MSRFRIGQGFDIHPFAAGRGLVLGSIAIPHARGLAGHSDADVALHALTDALLGALAAGDIGRHFSDRDPRHKDRRSSEFVRDVMVRVRDAGYGVANTDITIIAEEPHLAPYLDAMRDAIAVLLEVGAGDVNVKATRGEGLGALGRGEGIAAQAVVLLERRADAH